MTSPVARSTRIALALLLLAFAGLSLAYNVTVPLFEGPDETFHFFYVKRLVDGLGFPVIVDRHDLALLGPEVNQAPLYYLTGALVAGRVDISNAERLLWYNPAGNRGNPAKPGNKNIVVHTDAEAWPYRDTVLAIHGLRGISLLLGLATVLATFLTARMLFRDDRPALLAAGLNAFIPQFIFSSALVSNDLMITAWCVLGLYLLLRLVARPGDLRVAAGLGVLLGLAALTKLSGVLLVLLAGGALLLVAWRRREQRIAVVRALLLVGVLVALIAGWWYVRGWILYGDPTGEATWRAVGSRGDKPIQWWGEFTGLRWSWWGLFGWFSILLPEWIYRACDGFTVLALAGLVYVGGGAARSARLAQAGMAPAAPEETFTRRLRWGIVAAWVLVLFASLVRWNTIAQGFQGRLMFPAISAICVLLIAGWLGVAALLRGALGAALRRGRTFALPGRAELAGLAAIVAALGVLALLVPGQVLAPAYARPPVVSALPAGAIPLSVTYGDGLTLLGYHVETRAAGAQLPVTFYWQARHALARDYTLAVKALGRDYQPAGKIDTYPGDGTYPTSLWAPGQIIADHYDIPLEPDAPRPVLLQLAVAWFDGAPDRRLPADPPDVLLDAAKLAPAGGAPGATMTPVRFGDAIELAGFRFTQDAAGTHVVLQWRALARPADDYTVFVHVIAPGGAPAGGADGPPVDGRYPTRWWDGGEFIEDDHVFAAPLPAGRYTVEVGLYRPGDGARLPVLDASGNATGRNAFVLPADLVMP